MSGSYLNGAQPDTGAEQALRHSVELALARASGNGAAVAAIHRRLFPGSTSYPVEIVTVELATGDAIEIFLKDYGRSRLPKDAAADRRERELRVYEELLRTEELGTARFYGACRDDAAARFWLLLEFVDGELLRDCTYEYWPAAAGWLGRLHGHFRAERERLQASRFLVRHDAGFFVRAAEHALGTLSDFSAALAGRLARVLKGYDEIVALLSREPESLVHGSYRPQNVLVDRSHDPVRICPTDWELAAFGRRTYDLAFLCDGFRPPRLDELFDAYESEAEGFGIALRDRDELRHEVDCFRLHKTVNSLGHLRQWPHPEETAAKVVATAEEIARTLA
jgi:aminoglycoside phosphotransferase (APT) family kinase protein